MVAYAHEKGLLFQAAGSAYGIVVKTADMQRDIDIFKAAKRDEPALQSIEVWRSPWSPTDEIWLVKTRPRAEQPRGPGRPPKAQPWAVVPPDAVPNDVSLDDLDL